VRHCANSNRFRPSIRIGFAASHNVYQTLTYSRADGSLLNIRKRHLAIFVRQTLNVRNSGCSAGSKTLGETSIAVSGEQVAPSTTSATTDGPPAFAYALAAPAVFIMLMMGIAPLLYVIVVSFQRLSLSDQITDFQGLLNYARLLNDMRFWEAVLHTAIITMLALPIELVLGLLLAYHDRSDGGAIVTLIEMAFASRCGLDVELNGWGENTLSALFAEELGASPLDVAATRRLLFAKQLLTETALPISRIAEASGYASLRRFNAAFVATYGKPPREFRRGRSGDGAANELVLRLPYRAPYDFAHLLEFYGRRTIPGVESVDASGYRRSIVVDGVPGWFAVSAIDGDAALALRVHHPSSSALGAIAARVKRMFDVDADPRARKTFQTLGRVNLFALAFRTNNMKTPAGRARKIASLVAMLARAETIVPETGRR